MLYKDCTNFEHQQFLRNIIKHSFTTMISSLTTEKNCINQARKTDIQAKIANQEEFELK
jgi:hypothetical protein